MSLVILTATPPINDGQRRISMAKSINYHVQHIHQDTPNTCWHAASRMVYGYKKRASVDPKPDMYKNDKGIPFGLSFLNQELGFSEYMRAGTAFTRDEIYHLLVAHGPFLFVIDWSGTGAMPTHVIVVSGIDANDSVHINDPADFGPTKQLVTIDWLNQHRSKWPGAVMYLP